MSDGSSSATGGLLVVLGIIVALGAGYLIMQSGGFGHSGPSIKVEAPNLGK